MDWAWGWDEGGRAKRKEDKVDLRDEEQKWKIKDELIEEWFHPVDKLSWCYSLLMLIKMRREAGKRRGKSLNFISNIKSNWSKFSLSDRLLFLLRCITSPFGQFSCSSLLLLFYQPFSLPVCVLFTWWWMRWSEVSFRQ